MIDHRGIGSLLLQSVICGQYPCVLNMALRRGSPIGRPLRKARPDTHSYCLERNVCCVHTVETPDRAPQRSILLLHVASWHPPEHVGFKVNKGVRLKADCGSNGVCCFAKFAGF